MQVLYTPSEYLQLSSNLIVLFFTASWCAPCHLFKPKLQSLEGIYPEVLFAEIDVEDAVELADSFAISTLPTVVLVRDQAEVHRITGVAHKRPVKPVSQAIRRYLLGEEQQQQQQQGSADDNQH